MKRRTQRGRGVLLSFEYGRIIALNVLFDKEARCGTDALSYSPSS